MEVFTVLKNVLIFWKDDFFEKRQKWSGKVWFVSRRWL